MAAGRAIAVALLFRATLPLAALGMATLFAPGVGAYGLFHMMDHPIFLDAAVPLRVAGLAGARRGGHVSPSRQALRPAGLAARLAGTAQAPRAGLVPAGYAAALAGMVALYCGAHLALFGAGAA